MAKVWAVIVSRNKTKLGPLMFAAHIAEIIFLALLLVVSSSILFLGQITAFTASAIMTAYAVKVGFLVVALLAAVLRAVLVEMWACSAAVCATVVACLWRVDQAIKPYMYGPVEYLLFCYGVLSIFILLVLIATNSLTRSDWRELSSEAVL